MQSSIKFLVSAHTSTAYSFIPLGPHQVAEKKDSLVINVLQVLK